MSGETKQALVITKSAYRIVKESLERVGLKDRCVRQYANGEALDLEGLVLTQDTTPDPPPVRAAYRSTRRVR